MSAPNMSAHDHNRHSIVDQHRRQSRMSTTSSKGDGDATKSPRKSKSTNPDDSVPKEDKKSSVKFQAEEKDDPPLQGNFQHVKKKTLFKDFEEYRQGKDRLFHLNIATECETFFNSQKIRAVEKKIEHFAFIVDLDGYEYHKVVFHHFLNEILESGFFRTSILLLVLLNAILIGLQTDVEIQDKYGAWFHIADQIILSVFIFEILIKWIYDFRLFWTVWWNILDFFIVFLIILAAVVPQFGNSKALVVVRVVRAFRSLRSISFLSSLSVVAHTIIRSVGDMGNILIVLMIFMLVMSVMGVILFEIETLDTKRFLSATDAWFVLFICVTQDGWNQVLEEFREPEEYYPFLAIYLIFAVSIGAFVFANLIVAVIVANLELSVREVRVGKKLSDNPLDFEVRMASTSSDPVELHPIYDLLCKNRMHILSQRPLRIPNLRKFSQRRIQAYISLIVALEQNMLEAEIIRLDLERIMAVMLSVVLQLDMNSQLQAVEDENKETKESAIAKSRIIDGTVVLTPEEMELMNATKAKKPITSVPPAEDPKKPDHTALSFIQILKNRNSAEEDVGGSKKHVSKVKFK